MPQRIRVVSYNIHHGTTADEHPSLLQIASVLDQLDADLISLQEVDMNLPRSQRVKQAAMLAKTLDMGYVFGEAMHYGNGKYGNAVLSRFPIKNYHLHKMPDSSEDRCCLEVHIQVNDKLLGFFAVHLGLKQTVRIDNVKHIILPAILAFPGPAILAGDLNADCEQPEIQLLSSQMTDTFDHNSGILVNTFPSAQPVERIDYIFTRGSLATTDFYITDASASDHLPVTAEMLV